jgi:hypothetical protein
MIDLYALPPDFPGWNEAHKKVLPLDWVLTLESAFQKQLGEARFLPYIQLHEFETLLYCDLSQLARRIDNTEKAFPFNILDSWHPLFYNNYL